MSSTATLRPLSRAAHLGVGTRWCGGPLVGRVVRFAAGVAIELMWLLRAPRRMYLVATHPHTTEMSTGAIPAARQRPTGVSLSVGLGRVCAAQHVAHGKAAAALDHAFRGGSATTVTDRESQHEKVGNIDDHRNKSRSHACRSLAAVGAPSRFGALHASDTPHTRRWLLGGAG